MPTTDKPNVALNLDTLEREGAPTEFATVHAGKRIVMTDALEIDWQVLIDAMSNPHKFFKLIVPDKDQGHFFEHRMPSWKMRALMDAYTEHHGLTDQGNLVALPR